MYDAGSCASLGLVGLLRTIRCALAGALGLAALLLATAPLAQAAPCKRANAVAGTVKPAAHAKAIRCLINKERRSRSLKPLRKNKALNKAARRHSRVQDRKNCFSHRCPGEPGLGKRVRRAGYPGCRCSWRVGEVIGWRTGAGATPRAIVRAWMGSDGHRANLLEPSFRHIGAGIVYGAPRKGFSPRKPTAISTVVMGSYSR